MNRIVLPFGTAVMARLLVRWLQGRHMTWLTYFLPLSWSGCMRHITKSTLASTSLRRLSCLFLRPRAASVPELSPKGSSGTVTLPTLAAFAYNQQAGKR